MKKDKKQPFIDDGRVVADMDCEYITGYKSKKQRKNREELSEMQISRKERWAIYKAALQQFMPVFGMFLISILLVIFLLYFFWMN